MPEPIIAVENLGKCYALRAPAARSGLLRDTLGGALRNPLRMLRGAVAGAGAAEDFWAVRDLSFTVQPGEIVGIIGRNGAGKSTLLKMLSRITDPTAGRIRLRGRVASLLEVGTGFHPDLSGRENIFLNGAILGMTRAEIRRRLDEIVAFAEVEQFLDTPVKRYSSGMYVRLAFAVAAHLDPEILIIDEVLAVGDAAFQRKCLAKLQSATRDEGRTILFVSHNLAAVRQLCSRALVLQAGRLVADGPPPEAIAQYMSLMPRDRGAAGYRHIAGDGRALITSLRLNVPGGTEPLYAVFEPIRLEIDFAVKPDAGPLEFFLLIYGEDGECLASSFQRDTVDFHQPASGTGTVSVAFKNMFLPGRYLVSAGIFDRSRQFLDWVEFAEGFQVESSFADGRAFDNRLGRVSILPEWSV
ncbi:ABC transporter ATP-binding protein [Opitutus sp. GAS368]|jgi:lipopolysaccharide transport system ATP-binding protein|uniref:ABC transporter ATP-binding protein n=1 Tax=Opitutus sp. GAS368 TaxID=1882749 RepID=UPI00087D1D3E|nr:ABC transporter ATP-binding protein [Opitutus sp. GAS368]SDS63704.1 lipopolysaccharide transport system ATP-binding protein [Opitutus sp. GAS368]